ncbi:MAG: hypothetical protein GY906_24865 [bacterium]|nr:hypothetical protein [bacterium]
MTSTRGYTRESGDYSAVRAARGPDRLTKWAVGAFLTLLLTVVIGLGGWAFTLVYGTADTALGNSNHNREELGLVKKDVEYIKGDVKDLKEGQKSIVAGQQKIIDILFTLPSQRRNQVKPVLELTPAPPERPEPE